MSEKGYDKAKRTEKESHSQGRIESDKQQSAIEARKKAELLQKNREVEKVKEMEDEKKSIVTSPDAP